LKARGIPSDRLLFILCRVGDSDAEIKDARDYIARAGYRVLEGELPERTAYRRATNTGRSFTEVKHRGLSGRADIVVQNIGEIIKQLATQTSQVA
jgi:chromosome partitioning protein